MSIDLMLSQLIFLPFEYNCVLVLSVFSMFIAWKDIQPAQHKASFPLL